MATTNQNLRKFLSNILTNKSIVTEDEKIK